MNGQPPGQAKTKGFTFVETLMALAIGAGVITTAVLAYQAVGQYSGQNGSYGSVELPLDVLSNLYGQSGTTVDAYYAPNYGRVALAEVLREKLYEDISESSAAYCLGRTLRTGSDQRPASIPIASNYDARRLDTPNAFRTFLAAAVPATDGYFLNSRENYSAPALSIFLLRPYTSTSLTVQAIYEVDFVESFDPAGTYATVRRYQDAVCTDYYDVFYPSSDGTVPFQPLAVLFERRSRLATVEGSPDLFKVAENRPFYMVWWPDPAQRALEGETAQTFPSNEPRSAYGGMTGRTSLCLVIPMFPSL